MKTCISPFLRACRAWSFYESVLAGNLEAFCISEKVAPGFYRFLERLKEIRSNVKFIKTQITGPFSMGLGLKDENGKPVIYNYGYFDIIKKALHMKAQWMIATIKAQFPDKGIIIFFDEPFMVSFGSAYVSISKEEAIALFNDVLGGIPATRGIHCCGNTDWSVLLNADVDIINYDAYNYLETIFYFEQDLKRFISRGGRIAPGIVPSDEGITTVTPVDMEHLIDKFRNIMTEKGGSQGLRDLIITTSCGVGSFQPAEARRAMELLRGIASNVNL
jgi:methionine synthase II (cobalamin-independent)